MTEYNIQNLSEESQGWKSLRSDEDEKSRTLLVYTWKSGIQQEDRNRSDSDWGTGRNSLEAGFQY